MRRLSIVLILLVALMPALSPADGLTVKVESGRVVLAPDVPAGTPVEMQVVGTSPNFTVVYAFVHNGAVKLVTVPMQVGAGSAPPSPPGPPEPLSGLALLVSQWVTEGVPAEGRAVTCARLADSFEAIASQIAAGAIKTVPEILKAAQASNSAALGDAKGKWSGVLDKLRVYLNGETAANRLNDSPAYRQAFLDIAKGLRRVK